MNKEKQIEEMDCKKCLHYEACQKDFRISKALSIYEDDYNEEQYFADTIDCDYYMDNLIYRKASDVAEEIITEVKRQLVDFQYRESMTYCGSQSKSKRQFEKDTANYRAIMGTVKYALAVIEDIKDKYTEGEHNGKND